MAAVIVTIVLSQPSTDDAESNDTGTGDSAGEAVGEEPPGPDGAEPSEPVRIPVRLHGSILLSVDASGVTTEQFDEADLDADPVVPTRGR